MSHELRTPLNGVLGYSQILARTPLDEQQQRGIEIIYQSGFHLLTLINDVLDLAKIEARKLELYPKPCYFPALLQGVVEISRLKAEQKSIDFIFKEPDNLPNGIITDEKRLRQVLLNLLSNAIKFTDRGSVTFNVKATHNHPSTVNLYFQVIDTGRGIEEEKLEAIFLPFEQAGTIKSQNEGTGLGLAITKNIVEMMGSSIKVSTEINKGSAFEIEVECPLAQDWIEANTLTNLGKITGYSGKRRTILVVDDRWENRSVIVSLLQPLGFNVVEAKDGAEGLEKAHEISPDLIITDLKMPIMSGWEMLKQIREFDKFDPITIIVSSASVFEADRQKSFAIGGNDFLAKPVEAEELYQMLVRHLKIEWIYVESPVKSSETKEKNQESAMVIPPVDELEPLWQQVMQGQIKMIKQELENLVDKDSKYNAFVEELKPLVEGFKIQELRQYLEKVMNKTAKSEQLI